MKSNERILIVDDDEMVLTCFGRLLKDRFNIQTALGAEKAVEVLMSEEPYAVVLSDLRMPGMNGVALLRKVREISPSTIRLLLSGTPGMEETHDAVREDIVHRVMEKPCETALLDQHLRHALAQYRKTTEA